MNAKILEIFQSIQGEGKYAGVRQVFVRFFECNMHCVWCDTPNSIGDTVRHYQELNLIEVTNKINILWDDCHSLSLTGGEPLLQAEFIKLLLTNLKRFKRPSYLETNGILPDQLETVIEDIDMIAMDLKLPSSTQCDPMWDKHLEFLKIAKERDVFVKAVISNETSLEDVEQSMDLVASVDPSLLFIVQPNSFDLSSGVMKKCIEYQTLCQRKLNNVRVIPQVHRLLKVR